MDFKLHLKSLDLHIPKQDVQMKLEGFELNLTNLDLKEVTGLAKELMSFISTHKTQTVHEPVVPATVKEITPEHTRRPNDVVFKDNLPFKSPLCLVAEYLGVEEGKVEVIPKKPTGLYHYAFDGSKYYVVDTKTFLFDYAYFEDQFPGFKKTLEYNNYIVYRELFAGAANSADEDDPNDTFPENDEKSWSNQMSVNMLLALARVTGYNPEEFEGGVEEVYGNSIGNFFRKAFHYTITLKIEDPEMWETAEKFAEQDGFVVYLMMEQTDRHDRHLIEMRNRNSMSKDQGRRATATGMIAELTGRPEDEFTPHFVDNSPTLRISCDTHTFFVTTSSEKPSYYQEQIEFVTKYPNAYIWMVVHHPIDRDYIEELKNKRTRAIRMDNAQVTDPHGVQAEIAFLSKIFKIAEDEIRPGTPHVYRIHGVSIQIGTKNPHNKMQQNYYICGYPETDRVVHGIVTPSEMQDFYDLHERYRSVMEDKQYCQQHGLGIKEW